MGAQENGMTLWVQVGTPGRGEEGIRLLEEEEPVPVDSHDTEKYPSERSLSAPPGRQQAGLDPL